MPRTTGKISRDGQDLTDFIPVKCRTELGMVTGHVILSHELQLGSRQTRYVLHLKDDRKFGISFSGAFGPRAYFYSVDEAGLH